jgi:glycosyltransferase involved in cell wall biosynthesis
MKISIVTNAFNQGRFLRRCMESVLTQEGVDIEYVVIDPGSTDSTPEILAEYEARGDDRIRIVREPDDGPADGLNKGFAMATGDWFIYLNADDFFLLGGLKAGAEAISKYPDADCIYGDGYLTDMQGIPLHRVITVRQFTAKRFVYHRALVLQQSTFYKAESFRAVGGFNIENRTCWDAELLVDMSLAGMKFVHVPGMWSAFAIYPDSITGSQRHAIEDRRNHERIFRKVMGRDRTPADLKVSKRLHLLDLAIRPGRTVPRLVDQFLPQHLPRIADCLPKIEEA